MEETGRVVSVDGAHAVVSVPRKGVCDHCTAGTCNVSDSGVSIEAINEAGATVGQTVRVTMRPYTYVKGSMLLYGVPAISLIAGAILGSELISGWLPGMDKQAVAAIAAFGLFGVSFLAIKAALRGGQKGTRHQAVVSEIIS